MLDDTHMLVIETNDAVAVDSTTGVRETGRSGTVIDEFKRKFKEEQ